MSMWSARGVSLRHLAAGLVLGSVAVLGCGQKPQPASTASGDDSTPAASAPAGKPVAATLASRRGGEAPVKTGDRLHQPFTEAVRGADNPPPADAVRPPDETVSKKPVHRLLETVRQSWDGIRFTTPAGAPLAYSARVETSAGDIEIALFPEQAPNHVRNFIALAKAGYYDKLLVERIRHEKNPETGDELHLLEGGCPLGTGTAGTGSIGYWLREEFTPADKMSHDEGIVGACRGEEADSAATRFYISLNKTPFLDGNYTIFGKVVQGLDIVRTIGKQPVVIDDEGNSHPEKPIVIHKVTIVSRQREATSK